MPPKDPPPTNSSGNIIHKVYTLYEHLYKCTKVFPKKDRYTLGVRIEKNTLEIFELIMLAREKDGQSRLLILKKTDVQIKILKLFIRLSFDLKILPEKRYIETEEKLVEIGKMLGGWIKYSQTKRPLL